MGSSRLAAGAGDLGHFTARHFIVVAGRVFEYSNATLALALLPECLLIFYYRSSILHSCLSMRRLRCFKRLKESTK
jgi:hypothetical protein